MHQVILLLWMEEIFVVIIRVDKKSHLCDPIGIQMSDIRNAIISYPVNVNLSPIKFFSCYVNCQGGKIEIGLLTTPLLQVEMVERQL